MFLLPMKLPIGIPIVREPHGTQIPHGLGARLGSAHTGLLHAILDQMAARAFDHPRPNRPAARQIGVIVRKGQMTLVGADRCLERRDLGGRAIGLLRLPLHRRDHRGRVPDQDRRHVFPHPWRAPRMVRPQQHGLQKTGASAPGRGRGAAESGCARPRSPCGSGPPQHGHTQSDYGNPAASGVQSQRGWKTSDAPGTMVRVSSTIMPERSLVCNLLFLPFCCCRSFPQDVVTL